MQVIEHIELASAQSSITFSSIPNTFTDLKIVLSGRSTKTANNIDNVLIRFNADSGTNYSTRILYGTGSGVNSAASGAGSNTALWFTFYAVTANQTANTFGNYEIYIPNYASSVAKSISLDGVQENNGTEAWQTISAGLWTGTGAITSVELATEIGNWTQYSSATLYGITAGSDGTTTVS